VGKIKQHLEDSNTNYFGHAKFALYAAVMLLYAALASVIHALLPNLFPSTAASIVSKLYNYRIKNHPNPLYRKMHVKE